MKLTYQTKQLAALILMGASLVVHAGLKDGIEATKAGNYEKGLPEILLAANAGSPLAQRFAGTYLREGLGIPKNLRKGVEWTEKSAAGGDTYALVRLATMFLNGNEVVEKDCHKALAALHLAASRSNVWSFQILSRAHSAGVCVQRDPSEVLKWSLKAAEQDEPDSQHLVGVAYWQGNGVKRNFDVAADWFMRAAKQGNSASMVALGMMFKGDGLPTDAVSAETWLRLAQQFGVPSGEKARLERELRHSPLQAWTPEQQLEVERRVAAFRPYSIWEEHMEQLWQGDIDAAARWDADHLGK